MKAKLNVNDYTEWARQMGEIAKMVSMGTIPVGTDWGQWRQAIRCNAQNTSPIWEQTDNRVREEDVVHPQWISIKSEDPKGPRPGRPVWQTVLAPWSPTTVDSFGRRSPVVEVVRSESIQPLNTDLPDDKYLYEMGCGQRQNESLDHRQMDDRDFRERCIVVGKRLYALYEKRKPDLAPRSDLRQEVLSKMLGEQAEYIDADTLAHVFRKMRLSRRTVLALVHGYMRPDPETGEMAKSGGLKSLEADELAEMAFEFESMNNELKEFDVPEPETNKPRTLDDERIYWLDVAQRKFDRGAYNSVLDQMAFIEESAKRDFEEGYYADPDHVDSFTIYRDEEILFDRYADPMNDEEELLEWDPEMDDTARAIESNVFGAHPLYDESSCISEELIDEIKAAGWGDLADLKSWLMGSEAWFLNSDQRKIAWSFIKGREDRLIDEAFKRPIAKMVGSYITETRDSGRACALLFAWKNGERFDTEQTIFKFDEDESLENELVAAWTIFRREHKAHQRERRIAKQRAMYERNAYRDRRPGERGPARVPVARS